LELSAWRGDSISKSGQAISEVAESTIGQYVADESIAGCLEKAFERIMMFECIPRREISSRRSVGCSKFEIGGCTSPRGFYEQDQ
jgi:hypothetical protein